MLGSGRGTSAPSARWSNCMKTRFHSSMNLSSEPTAGPPPAPKLSPRSQKISLDGPHGPVSAMRQKLSSSSRWMRSSGTPTRSRQIAAASSSVWWTVIQSRSTSNWSTSV
jgi:hypothetical protein